MVIDPGEAPATRVAGQAMRATAMLSVWNDPVFRLLDDVMGSTFGGSTTVCSFAPSVDVRTDESSLCYELVCRG